MQAAIPTHQVTLCSGLFAAAHTDTQRAEALFLAVELFHCAQKALEYFEDPHS